MKKSGKIFFLSVCCAAIAAAGLALTACGDKGNGDATAGLKPTEGLRYIPAPDGEEGYWVSGMGAAEVSEVVIPSTYLDEPVTGVASSAFRENEDLISVAIPSSVKTIGERAFYECGLLEVTFSEGLEEIGQDAFVGCKMNKIDLPESLKTIGESAFEVCDFLKKITIPAGVISIGDWSLCCSSLENITVAEDNERYYSENNCLIEKESKTLIRAGIKSEIPEGVVVVGQAACLGNKMERLVFPDSVTGIEKQSFSKCNNLTEVSIPSRISVSGWGIFYKCENLKNVTIEEGITFIEEYMFSDCNSLISVNLPSTLKEIRQGAFSDCISLGSITIPDSVEEVGAHTFSQCTSLEKLVIPKSVEKLDEYAFGKEDIFLFAEVEEGEAAWELPYNVTVYWAGEWEYRNGEPYPLG